ncbi:hypothetical protein SPAR8_1257 [Streptococcus pneumoniae GA05248]|nr:hypothetical protein SPAR123_1272 [Streptococcus pneumoniae 4027-06]EHD92393.1 hypothetical protein SPAR32_1354 [Streptococcus pneumoniae GA13637]EHZ08788.1 hypothetical protein SPAR8_1257 [Streptococcus pneumoniae GA05248]
MVNNHKGWPETFFEKSRHFHYLLPLSVRLILNKNQKAN